MAIFTYRTIRHTARCTRCGATEEISTADAAWRRNDSPGQYFHRRGWSDCAGVTLCPHCKNVVSRAVAMTLRGRKTDHPAKASGKNKE